MHAQTGALAHQMFAMGATDDGSSSVPTRIAVKPGAEEEFPKRWLPHPGQNRRRSSLPLAALLRNSLGAPTT